jgi:biotin transport system substrate-specific component
MELTVKEMLLAALFSSLTVLGAKLNLLLPDMPVTLQPVIVILSGCLIGRKPALLSQVVYVLMGIIGLPVFAKPGAGLSYVFQPSFGFLIGFIGAAYIIGAIIHKSGRKTVFRFITASMAGLLVLYVSGILYFYILMNVYIGRHISVIDVLTMMIPLLIKDIVLGIIVSILSNQIYNRIKTNI